MQSVRPKRMERGPEPRKISPDESAPSATTPAFVAQPRLAAPVIATEPASVAEPVPEIAPASVEHQPESLGDPWAAFADAHSVLVRGLEEFTAEVSGMNRSGFALAAEAAGALLGAKTIADAVEINTALARRETDVMIEGSAKLAEIAAKAISELTQPLLSRLGARWSGEIALG